MANTLSKISIIVITRNEAANISRTIESILQAVKNWSPVEVLLVDSASTDETVEIARRYPINIIRLKPSWFLSAAAGRYVGMRHSQGDLIMYLDGDMELAEGWLEKAAPFLQQHPELAGVTGYRRDIYVSEGQIIGEQYYGRNAQEQAIEVPYFAGAALYRRSALEKVGGFNPYIISDEEPEVCMRLRHAGYKLMRLPYLMCNNYTLPLKSWDYFVRRFRSGLWLGHGQVPRYHWGTSLFWTYLRERGTYVGYLGGIFITLMVLLLTLITRQKLLLGLWLFLVSMVLVAYWIRKRSLRQVWLSLLHQTFAAYGGVRGFLMTPEPPQNYPTDAEIVQMLSGQDDMIRG